MTFADLAGSEGFRENVNQDETKTINQSLLELGILLRGLKNQKPNQHISFRGNPLTMSLQSSLGNT